MAHLALYRKYRPQTFDELIGQEHVTEPLITALTGERLNHAYLFSGPRGCGKTSSARILARSLNCEKGPTPTPCGECQSCVALATGGSGSLDVVEIDAASHGGVDDARDLRERAFYAPVSSRFKVYVIDEAHMVSSAGFNALLKLVEEPPEFVKFVFATTEPEKVLGTIKSRTHHYPFRLVAPAVLRAHLERVCEAENVAVEPNALSLVVRASGGSVRDALSLLDQLVSGADASGVTYPRAVALLGVTDGALLDEACDALASADAAAMFACVDRVVEAGHDPRRFASDLLERLRDLLIVDKVPDAVTKGLIDAPADQLERMSSHALRLGSATLSRSADIIHDGLAQMKGTTSPRLVLELMCARMFLPAADDSTGGLLQRMERLERRFDIAEPVKAPAVTTRPSNIPSRSEAQPPGPATPITPTAPAVPATPNVSASPVSPAPQAVAPRAVEPPRPAPIEAATPDPAPVAPASVVAPESPVAPEHVAAPPPAPVEAPPAPADPASVGVADVRRLWPDLLERLKRRRVVWSLMQNASPVSVEKDQLLLAVQHQGLVRRFGDPGVTDLVVTTLNELLGVKWSVLAQVAEAGSPPEPEPPAFEPPPAGTPAEPPAAIEPDEPSVSDSDYDESVPEEPREDPADAAHQLLKRTLGARVISE